MRLEELIGRNLGRYHIIELIGRGGMAAVYRAHDTALRRDVALKILYPQYTYDGELVERFTREAVVAARLDHPSIVPIYDVGDADGLIYIAMKLLGTRSLADLLRERGTLGAAELAPIVDQIASALDYAHARDVVHRDIKPANILLDPSGEPGPSPAEQWRPIGRAVLTDFGIARSLDTSGMTGTGVLIGTPDYMAPEQIRGNRAIDGRVDIYALGVLIYRALTGRRPYEGSTQEVLIGHLEGAPSLPSLLDPSLPPEVDLVVRRAMARRPEDRYQSAGELARALREAAGLDSPTPPPGTLRAAEPRAVVPRVAAERLGGTLPPEAATLRGDARPPSPASRQASVQPARPERRWGARGLLALAALLVTLVAGGGLILAQRIQSPGGVGGAPPSSAPTSEPPAPTLAPPAPTETASPTATSTPTVELTAEPTATVAPTDTATMAPTTAPPTRTPPRPTTAPPTNAVTSPPTSTPTTEPGTATATATETVLPSATPTVTLTPTATPCPVAGAGGFGVLWEQNEVVRRRLGCSTSGEAGGSIAEQPFENGSMYYFEPREQIYVLTGFETGTWRVFEQKDLAGLATPTPAPDPGEGRVVPVGGFGLVWGYNADVRAALGYGTRLEAGLFEGARQPFEGGVMIWSSRGLGAGPTIYVLYTSDGTFERFADPNQ